MTLCMYIVAVRSGSGSGSGSGLGLAVRFMSFIFCCSPWPDSKIPAFSTVLFDIDQLPSSKNAMVVDYGGTCALNAC
jgi:hypothetical protein